MCFGRVELQQIASEVRVFVPETVQQNLDTFPPMARNWRISMQPHHLDPKGIGGISTTTRNLRKTKKLDFLF